MIHQASWPLLVLLTAAPPGPAAATPWPWYAVRFGGPALAALLAGLYLRPWPAPREPAARVAHLGAMATRGWRERVRGQARLGLFGLAIVLAAARLAEEPSASTVKLLLFGLADVAAFQMIHFGVVARAFPAPEQGQAVAILLFGVSWGLRDLFLTGIAASGVANLTLAFGGGLVIGLVIAGVSRVLRRWPGGGWAGAAGHWLVVYLVAGFIR